MKETSSQERLNPKNAVGVVFNPETVTLQGIYGDQISAYRAKRGWADILESNFLLERDHDFAMTVVSCIPEQRFLLTCEFSTACGRYAFWRLTNSQSPESQYLIETAHIPHSSYEQESFLSAPDLMQSAFEPEVFSNNRETITYLQWLRQAIKQIKDVF